eukprot:2117919-Pleurochrysis_carterae.AAC.1
MHTKERAARARAREPSLRFRVVSAQAVASAWHVLGAILLLGQLHFEADADDKAVVASGDEHRL